jgi:hypothetical protein
MSLWIQALALSGPFSLATSPVDELLDRALVCDLAFAGITGVAPAEAAAENNDMRDAYMAWAAICQAESREIEAIAPERWPDVARCVARARTSAAYDHCRGPDQIELTDGRLITGLVLRGVEVDLETIVSVKRDETRLTTSERGQQRIVVRDAATRDQLSFSWADVREVRGPVVAAANAATMRAVEAARWPHVEVEQTRGATPVALERVEDRNPDQARAAATVPWRGFVRPGKFRFVGPDVHPSRPFTLAADHGYAISVRPLTAQQARRVGLALGVGLPLLALIPIVVPFAVDMPKTYAAGIWAGGGVLAGAGIIGGLAIRFGRSRVELAESPRAAAVD